MSYLNICIINGINCSCWGKPKVLKLYNNKIETAVSVKD